MKFLYTLFTTFLLLQFTSLAQEGWFEQTSGTTFDLNSVYFLNESVGWAVGGDRTIYCVPTEVIQETKIE